MAVATERWSDRKLKELINGNWIAARGWDVVGYTNAQDAVAATGVVAGNPHPLCPYIKCTDIGVVEDKLSLCRVAANYNISSILPNPVNPVSRQPFVRWKRNKCAVPVDTDINGNAILNSALDAFKNYGNRNLTSRTLTIRRYEPYYDQGQADYFIDTVNSTNVTFEGLTFTPGQVYCVDYAPVTEYQEGCDFVENQYVFEIRTPKFTNLTTLQKRHPFQRRVLDQGLRCKYNDATYGMSWGNLYTAHGELITRDVLFDGTGKPLDTSVKVGPGGMAPVAQTLPTTVLKDPISISGTVRAVFLVYMDYPETDMTTLGVEG
jgi:hypothetical protein